MGSSTRKGVYTKGASKDIFNLVIAMHQRDWFTGVSVIVFAPRNG